MEAQPLLEVRLISPGSWRAAGSEGTRSGLPLAARLPQSPPPPARDSVRSVAPFGRRQEPPRASPWGAQRPRPKLLLSHHLAVTASQKRPHLAAARTRDGRGHCLPPGGGGGAEGTPREGEARGAGRLPTWLRGGASHWTRPGWEWGERTGLASREAGRGRRKHARFPVALELGSLLAVFRLFSPRCHFLFSCRSLGLT